MIKKVYMLKCERLHLYRNRTILQKYDNGQL